MEKRHIINLQGRDFDRDRLVASIYPPQFIEKGYCQCGCGAKAKISPRNDYRRGFVRGEPIPYLPGHNRRKTTPRFIEEDLGYKTPCWVWQNGGRAERYGQLSVDGVSLLAHRVMFALFRGGLPEQTVLDHLCRQRACVNPDHLDPVTQDENVFRMYVAMTAEVLAQELSAGGGIYSDIFALEGMGVRRVDANQTQIGEPAQSRH